MSYLLHILIMIGIYIPLALSLNLIVGYGGLLSMCHAAFYGIGAYTTTLLMVNLHVPFYVSLIAGIVLSSVLSILIAYPSLRLKGDYFVLASLGFQIIVFSVLYNWVSLTRGPYGIPGIPRPTFFGLSLDSLWAFLLFTLLFVAISLFIFYKLYRSQYGLILKCIRDDEMATIAMGKDTTFYKIWAFVIGSAFAAISGALYAVYVSFIDPTSFTLDESMFILTLVMVGGAGNLRGPLTGVVFLIILPEALRFLGLPDTIAPNVRQMIYGALIIFLMRKRPQGIWGEYKWK